MHRPLLFICLAILIFSCKRNKDQIITQNISENYELKPVFDQVDILRYHQEYDSAAEEYTRLLAKDGHSKLDSFFLMNQIAYCYLMLYERDLASPWLKQINKIESFTINEQALIHQSDYHFNQARFYYQFNNTVSAEKLVQLALTGYLEVLGSNHLKVGQAYTLLALIHFDKGLISDSTAIYAQKAHELFKENEELRPFSSESHYAMACASLFDRAHESGASFCKLAIENLKPKNPNLEIRIRGLWGQMIKKQADNLPTTPESIIEKQQLYEKAEEDFFAPAEKLIGQKNNKVIQEYYQHRITNAERFKDPARFKKYLKRLKSLVQSGETRYVYPDRLSGYFFRNGLPDSMIYYYSRFLEKCETDGNCNHNLLDEAYFLLRKAHLEKREFDKAIIQGVNGLKLYNCCSKDSDYTSVEFIQSLDKKKTPCLNLYGKLAQVLLNKYESTPNDYWEDLILAHQYFDLYAKYFYPSVLRADEESLLTFQFEISNQVFISALKASCYAYQKQAKNQWLDKAFGYMERMKSYLLFRDKLRLFNESGEQINRQDSILSWQGQINQLKHNEEKSTVHDQEIISIQAKLDQLLEQRRKDSLAYIELIEQPISRISDVQNQLLPDQALVHYLKNKEELFLLYIDRNNTSLIFKENMNRLNDITDSFRKSLESPPYGKSEKQLYKQTAAQLYVDLIAPIEPYLKDKKQLIVIPDKDLDHIPFEALLSPGDVNNLETMNDYSNLPYLGLNLEIIYSPAWRLYELNQKNNKSLELPLSLGIWKDKQLDNFFTPIQDSLQNNLNLKGTQFIESKQHFLDQQQRFDLLLLWMHASSSRKNRFDNQIFFGPPSNDTLYGFELSAHSIHAQLLILGSCESVYGTAYQGEGTFSLARSFMQAGTAQIVSSLWKVNAKSSGKLIAVFLNLIEQGYAPAKALQQAKLKYLQNPPEKHQAFPGYWAGFILMN